MPNSDTYRTIKSASTSLFKDKGSKFLGYLQPVQSEKEAQEFLQHIKAEHPKATHHCYAYRLGFDQHNYRCNDDGEPSVTAGRPILGQIDSHQCTQIMCIVVRYYGGTPLGTSGLKNAYKTATLMAFEDAEIITNDILIKVHIEAEFHVMHEAMKVIKDTEAIILHQKIDNQCIWDILISQKNRNILVSRLEKSCKLSFE